MTRRSHPYPERAPQSRQWAGASVLALSALAAAAPATLAGLRSTPDLLGRGLLNPDSAMRLVRLEDILAAHAPLHAVMRDGSGAGTVLHWSHLLDSLLLLLAWPLTAVMDWPAALHGAALAWGPLVTAALGAAIAWAALPAATRGWVWIGAFAAGSTASLGGYGLLGEVHHHVPAAVAAVMAAGWAHRLLRRPATAGGVALGAWAALGLWFTPEAAPFTVLAMGALWVAWFVRPEPRIAAALQAASGAFLILSGLALLADPPAAGLLAVEPDRLSLPWVALAAGAAAVAASARFGRRLPVLATGGALGALWLAAFPHFLHGPAALMTAEQASAFFGPIVEMKPVDGLRGAVEMLAGGVFAGAALAAFAWRQRGTPHAAPLAYAAACVAATTGLAMLHVRFATYPAAAGAVLLPVALTRISAGTLPHAVQSAARLALILLLLGGSHVAVLAGGAQAANGQAAVCSLDGAARLLLPYPGAIVLAGVNETPDLLYRTGVRTVGSLYHRNAEAFMRLRAAWRTIPDDAAAPAPPMAVRATGATLVLGCPHEGRSELVAGLPAETLLDRLIQDRPPAWLHRIADAGPGGYVLYGVAE